MFAFALLLAAYDLFDIWYFTYAKNHISRTGHAAGIYEQTLNIRTGTSKREKKEIDNK